MRLRSKLFYVFLAWFLSLHPSWRPRRDARIQEREEQEERQGQEIGVDHSFRIWWGTPVERNSGPSPELGKAKDNKASVEGAFSIVEGGRSEVVSSAVSEGGAERDDALGKEFWKAVDGRNFEWFEANWGRWENRDDLFDDVIAKGADFTVGFIQNVDRAKRCVLAALFDKGEKGMIDGVLERIRYYDDDLAHLTSYRHELAGSPEKFFRVLDRIKGSETQEIAVRLGVINLLNAKKHDLIVPFVNALGKGTFKSDCLKEEAILWAFWQGAQRDNQDIVELYYEHPMITSEKYACGLHDSWNDSNPNQVFQLLLKRADQGDLDGTKKEVVDLKYKKFRLAIDEAPKPVLPTGSRHLRPIERARHALAVLAPITGASDEYGPGSILASYLVDEEIWAREIERMKHERQETSENNSQEMTSEVEEDEGQVSTMCRIL